jgi:histidyl-tRNA synthetase
MASPVNPPRGMRDFLPADKARREFVLGVIRRVYASHGFDEIETPVVEDSARLNSGLGGDNEKLGYAVLKRGLAVDDFRSAESALDLADLGLRFDLTVPLARFYASHRAELPSVFRSIQLAPVWRAERPQKGRYRQFVQCDIDIIGEPSALAEVELLVATSATLDALGLVGCSIRINDRRLLTSMLEALGFPADEHASALITIDKLDKVGVQGVTDELSDRGFSDTAVGELAAFLSGYGARTINEKRATVDAITSALPAGVDAVVIGELAALADAVVASGIDRDLLEFDPFLVRGMGYYTGAIFEVAHPDFGYALGGGGRYDGMIGRFLGTDVPATGFSLGFERIVDLVELPETETQDAVVLLHDDVDFATLAALKTALIARGARVRLARRPRNAKSLLEQLAASGFTQFASVTAETRTVDDLELKPIR